MTDYNYIEIPRMNMKSSIFAELVKRIKELEEENEQLKELLERARGLMNCTKDFACTEATEELLAKIDEVLNE